MEIKYLILLLLLLIAVYTDMTQTRISNRLIVVGLLFGLVFRIFGEGWTGFLVYIVNISIPVILFYLLFYLHALGAGDIKLFSMMGAFLSREQLFEIIIMAFLAFAVLGTVRLLYNYVVLKTDFGKLTQIYFSPAIIIAYLISIWRYING